MDAFAATVDSELAASVRAMRKKLGLKQADAARLFGGGINAFSEYERGKTRPPRSTVVLLGLLDKHPELLAEIR
jgi:HTH-type transcriptional regulator / antitoxin MqsA